MMLKLRLQYFGHLMRRVTHWKRLWCWEGLGAGGEGDDRGWDGWMASQNQWTWVWVNSRSWWWTGRPGMVRFMGLQRVGHNWATELNWTEENIDIDLILLYERVDLIITSPTSSHNAYYLNVSPLATVTKDCSLKLYNSWNELRQLIVVTNSSSFPSWIGQGEAYCLAPLGSS